MQNARNLEVLILTNDTELVETVSRIASGMDFGVDLRHSSAPTPATGIVPDLVLADADMLASLGSERSASLAAFGETEVIVLVDKADVSFVREFMKAGARDVWPRPIDEQAARKELEHAMEKKAKRLENGGGKLVSFTDVKGGAGATTLAVNVAYHLSRRDDLKVLLVDMDIQFGDVATFLDIKPKASVIEALAQWRRLDSTLLDSLTLSPDNGLHVLASPQRPASIDAVEVDALKRVLDVALLTYDLVILDMPRIITDWTREAWRWSDHLFMVMQGSVAELRDARILSEYFTSAGIASDRIHFVRNRCGSRHSVTGEDAIRKTLGIKELHDVRSDYALSSKAQNSGRPLSEISPRAGMVRDVNHLADRIAALCDLDQQGRSGIIGRLIGGRKS